MALIVEIWWGRPHEIIVEDVDENGQMYVSAIIPNGPADSERRTFSCHGENWRVAQELARAFGWQPKGPLLRPFHPHNALPVRQASYEPDGWLRGIGEIEPDDARAWGRALEACLQALDDRAFEVPNVKSCSVLRSDMTLDEFRRANRGLTEQFIRAFAAFLAKGAFQFGWDS